MYIAVPVAQALTSLYEQASTDKIKTGKAKTTKLRPSRYIATYRRRFGHPTPSDILYRSTAATRDG